MKRKLFKNYVTPDGEERIKKYKYKCTSDSLIYGYIMGPFAEFSLRFVPAHVAPNTLTFLGFLFNLVPHLMIMYFTGDDLSQNVPNWLCILTGLSQFMYMNLDNMDGKQARRTQSSSSLGMLYDHGLDSVNGWLMGLNLASATRVGNGVMQYFVLVWTALFGFYFTMWEEYHLEMLNFGMINPVDEGLSLLNLVILFTGFVGGDFWVEKALFGVERNYLIIATVFFACTIGIVTNIIKVAIKCNLNIRKTLSDLKVPIFLLTCVYLTSYFSPTNIVHRRLRSLISCFGLGISKVVGHIQLAHCAGDKFYQWRRSFLLTTGLILVNTLSGAINGKCWIDEDILLNVAIVINLWCFLHYLLSITQQLTRVLDIKVFSIAQKKE